MPAHLQAPDIRLLKDERLPRVDFPRSGGQPFRVYIEPEVHENIWKHAAEDTSVEICGVLVGYLGQDDDGPFVHVNASIRGQQAANKFAEVTFTHETWSAINAEMDSKYADRRIVGWYHTHPSFGIFLSDRDCFIQENFFSGSGQIALVVDPLNKTEGVFVWKERKPTLADHFWVGGRVISSAAAAKSTDHAPPAHVPSAADSIAASRAIPWALASLQYLLVFLIGYLLANALHNWSRERVRDEAVARAFYQLGLRPGLEQRLADAQQELVQLSKPLQSLAQSQLKLAEDDEELKKQSQEQWKEVQQRLARSSAILETVTRDFCLDENERALLERLMRSIQAREAEAKPAGKATTKDGLQRPTGERTAAKQSLPAGDGSAMN